MKQRHQIIYRLVLCSASLLLVAACSESKAPNDKASAERTNTEASGETPKQSNATSRSALSAYVGEKICDILPTSELKAQFGAPDSLTTESKISRNSSKCNYSWPHPDAEKRKQAMLEQMMQNVQRKAGEKIKLNLRAMASDLSVDVDLKETKSTAANFVPRKLSEEELQKKIAQANEEANKRLTDEQKKALGGDGVGGMIGGLMRKSNERVEINGVGEAAYWLPMMGGSLSVLAAGYELTISPMLADDEAGNIEAARKVAAAILRQ